MKKINTLNVKLKDRSYPIFIGKNLIENINLYIPEVNNFSKIIIITDKTVCKNLNKKIKTVENKFPKKILKFIVPQGEKTKSFFYLESLVEKILKKRIDRNSLILCIGGGVIGDLVGLVSSLLLRGIKFVQIPTTLLAQVDSSVGGKTSINSKFGKNLIGSFNQPISVIISTDTLQTLGMRQLKSGYAEILKYSLIKNKVFFLWLQKNGKKILSLNNNALSHSIMTSCSIKSKIVSLDEKEYGIRELLNFGHTFGHALELVSGYSKKINHGEAIFIGMFLALKFSCFLGFCNSKLVKLYSDHLENLGILYKLKDYNIRITTKKFIELLKYDKKVKANKIKFILLKDIGKSFSYTIEDEKILSKFFKENLE